jgi:hypothetical protein
MEGTQVCILKRVKSDIYDFRACFSLGRVGDPEEAEDYS